MAGLPKVDDFHPAIIRKRGNFFFEEGQIQLDAAQLIPRVMQQPRGQLPDAFKLLVLLSVC
jgi:hypothetical protein